jgi:Dna[CI] antecedent, DciA
MEPIGDDVRCELARFGPAAGIDDVIAAWPDAVGAMNARNAWPARIGRDGTLHVHTADAIWAFELTQKAVEIAERVGVERIRFAPGPIPEPTAEAETDRPAAPRPSREHVEQAAELTTLIADEELRAAVTRAVAASLARAEADR